MLTREHVRDSLASLLITFLPCLYSGASSCAAARLLHANPKGRRSALFITTVTREKAPFDFRLHCYSRCKHSLTPPDLCLGEPHQTRWVSPGIPPTHTPPPEGSASHGAYHPAIYIPSTHVLHVHPLKSFHTWEPTSKTTALYLGPVCFYGGICGAAE